MPENMRCEGAASASAEPVPNGDTRVNPREIDLKWNTRIPLRGDEYLNALLYRSRPEPGPVLCTMTPYTCQTFHEDAHYFAQHGYTVITIDVRGRGGSGGVFDPGHEVEDAEDVIHWIAQQPYCDGRVAMFGGSYGGYMQWAAAKSASSHLAAMIPVASPCRGVDSPMRNNMFFPASVQWLALLANRSLNDKIFADQKFWLDLFQRFAKKGGAFRTLDSFVGCPSPLFQQWLKYPTQSKFWDRLNPTPSEYGDLTLPILTITGSYDAGQLGALTHYRRHLRAAAHRANHFLIIGPWDHAGTRTPKASFGGLQFGVASLLNLRDLHRQWFDWTLHGAEKPGFLKDKVVYYVMGAERWQYARSLEAVTKCYAHLFLRARENPGDVFHSGSLAETPDETSIIGQYVYDPSDLSLASLEATLDPDSLSDEQLLSASPGRHLVYHSSPFESDIEISGFFRFDAWIAIDQPDTDFRVTVHEIDRAGRSILLSRDMMRARYRTSLRRETLIESRAPLHYKFDRFTFVSRLVRKGHRLRLVFGPINSILNQRNLNSGGVVADETMAVARPVTVSLIHDAKRPSVLHIPIGTPENCSAN